MMGKLSKRVIVFAAMCLAGCGARLAAAKVEEMSGGAPNKVAASLDTMRANWNELALDARVSLRLRWEKDLQNVTIQVQAKNGIIELKGKVGDIVQRQRAVQVARSTVGVVDVVDGLDVAEQP
jgi:osmotically-inducible protein OsmY